MRLLILLLSCIALFTATSVALIFTMPSAQAQTSVTAIALFKDRAMLSVDGQKAKIVRAGNTHKGVKLISSNTSEAVIEVNGQQDTLVLNGTTTVTDQLGSFDPALKPEVTIRVNEAGFFESRGAVNGKSINFLVDTGANIVVMNSIQADAIGLDYQSGQRSLASTASGNAPMYTLTANRMSLGSIELRDVDLGVIEGAFPEIPLLGMTFLSRLDMIREGNVMTLKKR